MSILEFTNDELEALMREVVHALDREHLTPQAFGKPGDAVHDRVARKRQALISGLGRLRAYQVELERKQAA